MKALSLVVCGILCTCTVYAGSLVLASGGGGNPVHINVDSLGSNDTFPLFADSNGGGSVSFIFDKPVGCNPAKGWCGSLGIIEVDLPVSLTAPGEFIKGFSWVPTSGAPFAHTTVIGTASNGVNVKPFYRLYLGNQVFLNTLNSYINVEVGSTSQTSAEVLVFFTGFPPIYPGTEFSFDLNNFTPNQRVGTAMFFVPESPVALEGVAFAGVGLLALALRRRRSKKTVGSLI